MNDEDVTRASVRVVAAQSFMNGTILEFEAASLVGTRAEIEKARVAAIAALEAMLDRKEDFAHAVLISQGIDPDTRG